MTSRFIAAVALADTLVLAPRPAAVQAPAASLYLTSWVLANDILVSDLTPKDVMVREDETPREVLSVTPTDPLAIILLLDVSPSLKYSSDMGELTSQLAEKLRPADRMSVWHFGPDVVPGPALTRDPAVLSRAAREAWTGERRIAGPSPLWDALNAATATLEREAGHRVILVVTDGAATGNLTPYTAVVGHVLAAGVDVNAVVPGLPLYLGFPSEDILGRPWERIRRVAAMTGGAVRNPGDSDKDVKRTFMRMFDELLASWRVTFRPGVQDGRRHALDVRVMRRGLAVRARTGYIAKQ